MSGRKKLAIVLGSLAVVLAVVVGVAYMSLARALRQPLVSKSDELAVEAALKGSFADAFIVRQPQASPNKSSSQGLIEAYQKDPEHFKSNAKYFDTWVGAARLVEGVHKNGPDGDWVRSSSEMGASARAADGWGHDFCAMKRGDIVLVISAGPNAKGPPKCQDVQITQSELAKIPRGRLLETPAHSLILVASSSKQ